MTGLYFYDNACSTLRRACAPPRAASWRSPTSTGAIWRPGKLSVVKLGRGYAWLDTGTHDSLIEASQFVRSIQHRQGLIVGCPEEIAFTKGFIDAGQLRNLADRLGTSSYGTYLHRLLSQQDE